MDVTVVRWPAEAPQREQLVARGMPRLLVLDDGVAPPGEADCLEDWVRMPASDLDLRARMEILAGRAARHGPPVPSLDADGVLRFGGAWAALPPVEARLTGALVERFGAVVSREVLGRSGWPSGPPRRNALDVHVLRLRRRVSPVGLVIRTVRSRGYLLESV